MKMVNLNCKLKYTFNNIKYKMLNMMLHDENLNILKRKLGFT